ncbi:hypothetical protein HDU67_006583 [Dinochytrium kinnereticum]|nr:hypothetical protein HDU67_006583 [Dinochytrium kinnereticum]
MSTPAYFFPVNIDEAATMIVLGGLIVTGIQNSLFSVYLVLAFQKGLDIFKLAMNLAVVVTGLMFALFLFPFGSRCQFFGFTGNAACQVFLLCIGLLLMLRVLTLVPTSLNDRLIVALLIMNRLAAGFADVIMSPSSASSFDKCKYHANVSTGWWYISSDIAIDLYVTIRNFMIIKEAEKLVGDVPFFSIYRNWNMLRSGTVLVLNVITGLFLMLTYKVDHSIYLMAATLQFMVLSFLMTYDMTFMKTAETKLQAATEQKVGQSADPTAITEESGPRPATAASNESVETLQYSEGFIRSS